MSWSLIWIKNMKLFKTKKSRFLFSIGISLLSVFVAAISTAAWFAIDAQPLTTSMVSSDANLTIDDENVYGYKIEPVLSNNGVIDYSNETVTATKGSVVEKTNNHKANEDLVFDVPEDGIGYYLIIKNPGGTYKYFYTDTSGDKHTMYHKFDNEFTTSNKWFADNVTLENGASIRIKHYTFNLNHETVNEQIQIADTFGASSTIDSNTHDVNVATGGTYKVWFDKSTRKIGFEKSFSISTVNRNPRIATLRSSPTPTITNSYKMVYLTRNWGWNSLKVHYWGSGFDSTVNMYYVYDNTYSQGVYMAQVPTNSTAIQFVGTEDNQTKYSKDITLSSNNAYNFASWDSSAGKANMGTWSESEYTYYFVNEYGTGNDSTAYFGSTPYCFAKKGSTDLCGSGFKMNATNQTSVFAIKITTQANKIFFENAASSATRQTVDISVGSSQNGKYYGLIYDTNATATQMSGTWYTNLPDSDKNTFYYFDNRQSGRWNPPYAYVWNGSGESNHYHKAWPGYVMTQLTAKEAAEKGVDRTYAWKISVSKSYTNIIFNKGTTGENANQTIDLTTSGNEGKFAVLTTQITTSGSNQYKWNVGWSNTMISVIYKAVYFIDGHKMTLNQDQIDTESTISDTRFTPTKRTTLDATRDVNDDTNGVMYTFSRESGNYIYTADGCASGNRFTDGNDITSYLDGGTVTFYIKYETSSTSYKTFYVDTTNAYHSDNSNHWTSVKYCFTDGTVKASAVKVADDLFRITAPSSWGFRLSNGGSNVNGDNYCAYRDGLNSNTLVSGSIILNIGGNTYNVNHSATWDTHKDSTSKYGTATIMFSVKKNGAWTDFGPESGIENVEMDVGDATVNYFVYEHGVALSHDTRIRIQTSQSISGHTTFGWNEYYGINGHNGYTGNSTTYVTSIVVSSDRDVMIASNIEDAKYNFYITSDGKFTITMVPDRGNGFYIMPYSSDHKTNNYIGGVKMNSTSNASAMYSGYYARSGTSIFIRSYLDAVDKLYTEGTQLQNCQWDNSISGKININVTGYYNIEVSNGKVIISTYSLSDFFKLNPLDTTPSMIESTAAIKAQKTSLVLEIPFRCAKYVNSAWVANKFSSNIKLDVDNSLSDFVGVALYVRNSKIDADHLLDGCNNPYSYMRGNEDSSYRYSLSNASANISDNANVTISAGTSSVYYAYILIDYLPATTGSYTNFTNSTYLNYKLSFYLKAIQS